MRWSAVSSQHEVSIATRLWSHAFLLLPVCILLVLAARTESVAVAVGAGIQLLFLLVFINAHPVWRPPAGILVVVLYVIAFVWSWLPLRGSLDWVVQYGQGLLLLVGALLLAIHDLMRSGAEPMRRANWWMRRIAGRKQWPLQLADCRTLPEALALREAIHDEPGPALALLADPRPEVQAAALGALEHRSFWRPGEAELVLKFGRETREPAVRAAAVYALAGVETADLIGGLASFLRDPSAEVRMAASEAVMWNADTRWPFMRDFVKEALADPKLANEGALFTGANRLPAAAIADMISWSSEHPPLAQRAIVTLIEHYHADLLDRERPELGSELAAMMLSSDTPPPLRVELASLLRDHHLLSPDLLDRLTNPDQPGPIRLFAAELMLRINPHDPDGVDVLRGLARQPNREMAVRVAGVLQSVLGLDLGLAAGNFPAPHSKQAAEVARRVIAWANGANPDVFRTTPRPRAGVKQAARAKGSAIPPTPPPSVSGMDESAYLPRPDDDLLSNPSDFALPDEALLQHTPRPPRPGSSSVF